MAINKEWHLAHKMPRNPTLDQKVTLHFEHAQHCSCRRLDEKMRDAFVRRGLDIG